MHGFQFVHDNIQIHLSTQWYIFLFLDVNIDSNILDKNKILCKTLILFGTCWGTLVFGTKYFSNSLEAIILAITLCTAFTSPNNVR